MGRFWRWVPAIESDTAWNRGIPCKCLKLTNKMLFYCLLSHDFFQLIKQVIKEKNFVNSIENICRTLRQLWSETGWSFAKFWNHYVYSFMVLIFISESISKVRPLLIQGIIYVGNWGIYNLKQGNPLQNFHTTNKVTLILLSFLWFYFSIKKSIKGKTFVN